MDRFFIDPSWIKRSEYPAGTAPPGVIGIDVGDADSDCSVVGFYDPATGEIHIQEIVSRPRQRTLDRICLHNYTI